jgi:hypothetical protein
MPGLSLDAWLIDQPSATKRGYGFFRRVSSFGTDGEHLIQKFLFAAFYWRKK